MADMSTAPKDGTRILLKCKAMHFHHGLRVYVHRGYEILEARWIDWDEDYRTSGWEIWCGDDETISTHKPDPVAWYPIPDELKDEAVEHSVLPAKD